MKRKYIFLLNVFYWLIFASIIGVILLATRVGGVGGSVPFGKIRMITGAIIIIPSVISFYGAYLFLFPKYLQKRSLLVLAMYTLVVAVASALFGLIFMSAMLDNQFTLQDDLDLFTEKFIVTVAISFLNIVGGFIIKGFVSWYSDLKIKEELQEKASMMELSLIESKLDPHFLFNTINNIGVLIQRDPTKASSYLHKLSGILRFILYESKGKKIKLSEEIDYILRYIELEKIRTSNQSFISVDILDEGSDARIYPVTFIPFIENAFKHCNTKKIENAIQIRIHSTKEKVHFKCRNRFKSSAKQANKGIGNELIVKRLQLLYGSRHSLAFHKDAGTYSVDLKIEL